MFVGVLRLCAAAGLIPVGTIAIDGTKAGTDAALDANRSRTWIRDQIETILDQALNRLPRRPPGRTTDLAVRPAPQRAHGPPAHHARHRPPPRRRTCHQRRGQPQGGQPGGGVHSGAEPTVVLVTTVGVGRSSKTTAARLDLATAMLDHRTLGRCARPIVTDSRCCPTVVGPTPPGSSGASRRWPRRSAAATPGTPPFDHRRFVQRVLGSAPVTIVRPTGRRTSSLAWCTS